MLTKENILKAKDTTIKTINVPEWGGDVGVKKLSGKERDMFELSMQKRTRGRPQGEMDTLGVKAELLVLCLVDEQGTSLFNPTDIAALNDKSGDVIDRVFDVARTLNGLSKADIKELEKNSESDTRDASGSDLLVK